MRELRGEPLRCAEAACDFTTIRIAKTLSHFMAVHAERRGPAWRAWWEARRRGQLTHAAKPKAAAQTFTCENCLKPFGSKTNLVAHVRKRHRFGTVKLPLVLCEVDKCNFSSVTKIELFQHFVNHHAAKNGALRKASLAKIQTARSAREQLEYQCNRCAFRTSDRESIRKHLGRDHTAAGFAQGRSSRAPFCDDCGVKCHSSRELVVHARREHNPQVGLLRLKHPSWTCDECGEGRFATMSLFLAHRRRVHAKSPFIVCDLDACSFATRRRDKLFIHYKTQHRSLHSQRAGNTRTKQLPLQCDDCPIYCPIYLLRQVPNRSCQISG